MANTQVPSIFDRHKASAKWSRARDRQRLHGGATFLTDAMSDDIVDRLDFMRFEPRATRVVGDFDHRLTRHLTDKGAAVDSAVLGEFDELSTEPLEAFDLIIHLLGLGMVNDLPGALIRARNELCEGGLFLAAFPGAGSLPVLRQLTLAADGERPAARIHPQVDIRAGTALLERAGFARQVVDSYPIKVRFPSLEQLISDLRDHGLTSSLATRSPPITRTGWRRAEDAFDALRDEDGKVTETFEILVLTGWR